MIEKHNEELIHKSHSRYNILRVRNKISFMAFEKKMTVAELILRTIMIEYNRLVKLKELPKDKKIFNQSEFH